MSVVLFDDAGQFWNIFSTGSVVIKATVIAVAIRLTIDILSLSFKYAAGHHHSQLSAFVKCTGMFPYEVKTEKSLNKLQ